jgi:hypothetical protein
VDSGANDSLVMVIGLGLSKLERKEENGDALKKNLKPCHE